jgi:hypothetical protein
MMSTALNDCGCCEGIAGIVSRPVENRPGLSTVRYRVGTHGDFLQSALAALASPRFAALRALTTRERNDFTIALLDGWATLADVLTFYQERIANELWLRTASERDSILRLAQLIGYRLKPGVAAETPLSFTLDETPGAPAKVTVEIGTKVQSIPGEDEKPQTFETIEELDARVEWNAMRPLAVTPPVIDSTTTSLWLKGTATNLQVGDAVLIIGDERTASGTALPNKDMWGLRVLLTVTPDAKNDRTFVAWKEALGKPPALNVQIFAMRQRAGLFGHNAPDPRMLNLTPAQQAALLQGDQWKNFTNPDGLIDLDNIYPKIVPGSWVALVAEVPFLSPIERAPIGRAALVLHPQSVLFAAVAKAETVTVRSRADFALSAKITRIAPDASMDPQLFGLRETVVYAQSERLEMTGGPLLTPAGNSLAAALTRDANLLAPIEGSVIPLDRLVPRLEAGRKVFVTGKPLRARVAAPSLVLLSADGLQTMTIARGVSVLLMQRPAFLAGNLVRWTLRTNAGFEGVVTTNSSDLILTAAENDDADFSELAVVQNCSGDPSVLTLESPPLTRLYDRASVTILANVADATHGESVTEVLGSGDAAQATQRFVLKQTPLTYIRSTTAGGAESSLKVRINDLLWREVSTLFERAPHERIFTTALQDDGAVTVRFGDGLRGARLPSGTQNVKATYRRGSGLEGLVRAGQLSTLLTRPPGLKSAVNPLAAEGADEPESLANARENAPLTVLTLERVVSLEDYENFSRAYAGIARSLATWTWDGRARGIFLTVAGPRGAAVSTVLAHDLVNAIHRAGDPFVPVRVESYGEARFRLSGQLAIHSDYEPAKVLDSVIESLRAAFSFEHRRFGQPVMLSEVIALVQSMPGVVAVNIDKLHRAGAAAKLNPRLEAALPTGADPAALSAAELLMLDPAPIDLRVMS